MRSPVRIRPSALSSEHVVSMGSGLFSIAGKGKHASSDPAISSDPGGRWNQWLPGFFFFFILRRWEIQFWVLTNIFGLSIMRVLSCEGQWCNGNTWVSKTFVEGSSPSCPAWQKSLESVDSQGSSGFWRPFRFSQILQIVLDFHRFSPTFFMFFWRNSPQIALKKKNFTLRNTTNSTT